MGYPSNLASESRLRSAVGRSLDESGWGTGAGALEVKLRVKGISNVLILLDEQD